MTREEILALEPSVHMDAIVAEHVMGYKKTDGYIVYHEELDKLPCYEYEWETECIKTTEIMEGGGISSRYFEPSTNIIAAWDVVEKLSQSIQCHMSISTIWPKPQSPMEYRVHVITVAWDRQYTVDAPTASEAISKAALLAVMNQYNG